MSALLLAVFVASVIGSLHCAGMCGPLLACAVATPPDRSNTTQLAELGAGFGDAARHAAWWSRFRLHAAYHGGRLVSYTALGAAAGAVGALLDLGGVLTGVQPVAAALAGGTLIVIGVATLSVASGRMTRIPLPKWWTAGVAKAQGYAMRFGPGPRAGLIGLCTTLLPCGWLYAFAVTAAGTGSAAWGAAVMAVFWAGTLPVLATLGAGLQGLLGLAGRRLPLATGVAMIAVGVFTLTHRVSLSPAALAATVEITNAPAGDSEQAHVHLPDANKTPACCPLGQATADTNSTVSPEATSAD